MKDTRPADSVGLISQNIPKHCLRLLLVGEPSAEFADLRSMFAATEFEVEEARVEQLAGTGCGADADVAVVIAGSMDVHWQEAVGLIGSRFGIPVLCLVGVTRRDQVPALVQPGVDDFAFLPVAIDELENRLQRMLRQNDANREGVSPSGESESGNAQHVVHNVAVDRVEGALSDTMMGFHNPYSLPGTLAQYEVEEYKCSTEEVSAQYEVYELVVSQAEGSGSFASARHAGKLVPVSAALGDVKDEHTGEKLLTPAEAAELLGVSRETLRLWRKRGYGPPFTRPDVRKIRYPETDLQVWRRFQSANPEESAEEAGRMDDDDRMRIA